MSERFRPIGIEGILRIPAIARLPRSERLALRAVAAVLPFRVNRHVVDTLVDWDGVPDDPLFRAFFPSAELLDPTLLRPVLDALAADAPESELATLVARARAALNANPADQVDNVPLLDGQPMWGVQHKYRETVLFFPSQGQQCHTYCAYCFRWSQFVKAGTPRFADPQSGRLAAYLTEHPEVDDVLFTGGDPMLMGTGLLRRLVRPLLDLPHLRTIRFGTKALTTWPARFLEGKEGDALMGLFEEVRAAGKAVAVVGHLIHPRELGVPLAQAAVARVRASGAFVWAQGPLLRGVNDDPDTLAALWQAEVALGIRPYYTFVPRNTGADRAFSMPLRRIHRIVRDARARVSGLARTAKGPVMSAAPGKLSIEGLLPVGDRDALVLSLVQARDPALAGALCLADGPPDARWLDELQPVGAARFPWSASPSPVSTSLGSPPIRSHVEQR